VVGKSADPLPDDAVVVRGGYMRSKSLLISATTHYEESRCTEWAWSFWCAPGKTADEIAAEADFAHDVICESTVGRIRAAGFEVESDSSSDDHCKIKLSGEPTDADCKRLRDAFDEARPRQ
jgi:hypothetical protein